MSIHHLFAQQRHRWTQGPCRPSWLLAPSSSPDSSCCPNGRWSTWWDGARETLPSCLRGRTTSTHCTFISLQQWWTKIHPHSRSLSTHTVTISSFNLCVPTVVLIPNTETQHKSKLWSYTRTFIMILLKQVTQILLMFPVWCRPFRPSWPRQPDVSSSRPAGTS